MQDRGEDMSEQADMEVLRMNRISFPMPAQASACASKTHVRFNALQGSYAQGQEVIVDVDSGAQLLNPHQCWLTFTLTVAGPNATTWSFGAKNGGALNCITRSRVRLRNGSVLSDCSGLNHYMTSLLRYQAPAGALGPVGAPPVSILSAAGSGQVARAIGAGLTDAVTFSIPLSLVNAAFSSQSMWPAQVSSFRLECALAPVLEAIVSSAGVAYSISDVYVSASLYTLSDSISRRLNAVAAQSSLNLVFIDGFLTQSSVGNVATFSMSATKTAALCTRAFVLQKDATAPISTRDYSQNLAPDAADSWYYQLSGLFLPTSPTQTALQGYMHTVNAFGKLEDYWHQNSGVSIASYLAGDAVASQSLDRTPYGSGLVLAGSVVSPQRPLQFQFSGTAVAAGRSLFLFVQAVVVCSIRSSSNAIVRS